MIIFYHSISSGLTLISPNDYKKDMKSSQFYIKLPVFLVFIGLIFSVQANAKPIDSSGQHLETVTLQLKWLHQFQFAGYYAALEKGFYQEAELNVVLKEARPGRSIAEDVVAGKAEYGIDMPNLLLERQKGKPIVVLAAILQHSPEILITRKDLAFNSPHDLIGKTVMLRPNGNIESRAMFVNEGVPLEQLNIVDHTWNLADLIDKKVDAISGYLTDRPFMLQERGVEYAIIRPLTYGVDFYGDCLFTTENEIIKHPERVKGFLEATVKGWNYAMQHPEEIVDLILQKYHSRLSREALLFEAKVMQELMQPTFIEIGHMNSGRWQYIADTFVKLKMLEPDYSLQGFLYDPNPRADSTKVMRKVWNLLIVLSFITLIVIILLIFNRMLKKEVEDRTNHLLKEISERKQIQEELALEKTFIDAIFNSVPGMLYLYDTEGRLVRWNRKHELMTGYSSKELSKMHLLDWYKGDDEAQATITKGIQTTLQKGYSEAEANLQKKDGSIIPMYFTASLLNINEKQYFTGIGVDITERKRAEKEREKLQEQLIQAQKMESVGRLAGGVAHDFNNMLTVIIGHTEIAMNGINSNQALFANLQEIHKAAVRSTDLTRQLLAFASKQTIAPKVLDLNKIVAGMLNMLGRLIGEDIDLSWSPSIDLWPVKMDPSQVDQIFTNLCINARDAIAGIGKITIETGRATFDDEYCGSHVGYLPGEYIILAVSDNGCGMEKETTSKLFEPFFTTKTFGQGTGLGLATVYGIVKQNNGFVNVYSEPDEGTTFRIYLPRYKGKVEQTQKESAAVSIEAGHETILLVEDEPAILSVTQTMLESLGYTVLSASEPDEGIELAEKYADRIDLLLTDVIMPGMNGRDLSTRLQSMHLDVETLFMSGYTANVIAHHNVLDEGVHFIPKPFTRKDLASKLREALNCGKKK